MSQNVIEHMKYFIRYLDRYAVTVIRHDHT